MLKSVIILFQSLNCFSPFSFVPKHDNEKAKKNFVFIHTNAAIYVGHNIGMGCGCVLFFTLS